MFERYTEGARRTLFFARYETSHLRQRSITPEHLLLGLLRENKGITAAVARRFNLSYDDVLRKMEPELSEADPVPTSVEIPFSPEVKEILHQAAAEADGLEHQYIGTEHLLLALLRQESGDAADMLRDHGLTYGGALAQVHELLAAPAVPLPEAPPADKAAALQHAAQLERLFERLIHTPETGSERYEVLALIAEHFRLLRSCLR